MPAVSIILPTFNRLRFLELSIQSVLDQSFSDWELIVADDGSDEETRTYLRGLESSHIRVLWLAHSGNPSRVRNSALAVASGKYVAFLDSDDVWLPTKLERQIAALDANEGSRWSYTACERIDAEGRRLPAASHASMAPRSGWIFDALAALETSVAMPTLVAERSLIEETGGFDEEQSFGEFHDLCLRLALRSQVVGLRDVSCCVRAHDLHYSADRAAAYRAWIRLYDRYSALAPSESGRARCAVMRARFALDLAALQSANAGLGAVWRTLRAGKVLSWRRPRFWYGYSLALLRPFVPSSFKTARLRLSRGPGAIS